VSVVEEESESLIIVNNVVETRYRACVLNSYELSFEVVFEGVIVALESLVVLVLLASGSGFSCGSCGSCGS
jgi:hypothetical protein